MKKNILWISVTLIVALIGAWGVLSAQPAGPAQAGVAGAVRGEVKAAPESAAERPLKSGDKIFMGDRIETGKDGQMQVLLLDETVFTLGPSSATVVDEFVYDPATDDGKVRASMLKGIFRIVTGSVAHKKPENMEVALPAGVIGFRGTIVGGIIEGLRSMVALLGPEQAAGQIYVSNTVNGKTVGVDITQGGYGTVIGGAGIAPVPAFHIPESDLNRIANAVGQSMTPGAAAETTGEDMTTASKARTGAGAEAAGELFKTTDKMDQYSQQAAQDKGSSSSSGHSSS
ncbi:MAG: FecR family protein [Candidatus Omnitrophota bacterium]